MIIGAIIQARTSSQRLPGKVLHRVQGKPLLKYILERLQYVEKLSRVVITTSNNQDDDVIEAFCACCGIACYRGELENVIERFYGTLSEFPMDAFVRVNGDSPLIDSELIRRGMAVFSEGVYDIVTNVFPRSYPKGQSVEIVSSRVFMENTKRVKEKDEYEHVTKFFYNNAHEFQIYNMASELDLSSIQLSVDTHEDMNVFASIVSRMNRPHWTYGLDEVLRLYDVVMEVE